MTTTTEQTREPLSPAFQDCLEELTAVLRTTVDLAIRAATWFLLEDDEDIEVEQ